MLDKQVFTEKRWLLFEDRGKTIEMITSIAMSVLQLFIYIRFEYTALRLSNILVLQYFN